MRRDGDGAGKGTALRREQEALPVSVLCPLIEQDDVQALKQAIQEDEGCVVGVRRPKPRRWDSYIGSPHSLSFTLNTFKTHTALSTPPPAPGAARSS